MPSLHHSPTRVERIPPAHTVTPERRPAIPARTYDWEAIRERYVTNQTITMADLARGPNAPAEDTIRRRAATEEWTRLRREHQHNIATRTRNIMAVDQAEVVSRHVTIARNLQAKALARLRAIDPNDLGPRDVLAFIERATMIEREALGMNATANAPSDQFDAIAAALADPVPSRHIN